MMRRCISGALKATETALALGESLAGVFDRSSACSNGRSARLVRAMKPATAPSAVKIQAVLGERFTVLEFEAGTRSAADAAAAIGCAVAEIAKSMIFRTVTSGRPVLVVASGDKRVDEKKAAAAIGEKIGRANADFVREATGFAIGGDTARWSRAAADRADR